MKIKRTLENVGLAALVTGALWLAAETSALVLGTHYMSRAKKHYDIAAANYSSNPSKCQQEKEVGDSYDKFGRKCLYFREKYGIVPNVTRLVTKEKIHHYDYFKR